MELILALILFAVLVVAWLALPSTVATTSVVETSGWTNNEGLQVAGAEA